MLIKDYVAEVIEQLRDFVPDGGEIKFEIAPMAEGATSIGCDIGYRNKREQETIVFSVPMTGSRVSAPATPQEYRS